MSAITGRLSGSDENDDFEQECVDMYIEDAKRMDAG